MISLARTCSRLWSDDAGSVLTAEVVLLATVLVIGIIVGATSFRDSAITEWADYAQAIGRIDQSYNIPDVYDASGTLRIPGGHFLDQLDLGDDPSITGSTLAYPGNDTMLQTAPDEGYWPY